MSKAKERLKTVYDEYIENSPGVDDYTSELFIAQDEQIIELEQDKKEMLDLLIEAYEKNEHWGILNYHRLTFEYQMKVKNIIEKHTEKKIEEILNEKNYC